MGGVRTDFGRAKAEVEKPEAGVYAIMQAHNRQLKKSGGRIRLHDLARYLRPISGHEAELEILCAWIERWGRKEEGNSHSTCKRTLWLHVP